MSMPHLMQSRRASGFVSCSVVTALNFLTVLEQGAPSFHFCRESHKLHTCPGVDVVDRGSMDVGGCRADRILLLGKPGEVDSFNCYLLKSHYVLDTLLDTAEDKKMNKKLPGFVL